MDTDAPHTASPAEPGPTDISLRSPSGGEAPAPLLASPDPAAAQLMMLLAALPGGFAFLDTDLRFVQVSDTFARMNAAALGGLGGGDGGGAADTYPAQRAADRLRPEIWERIVPLCRRALAGATVLDWEFPLPALASPTRQGHLSFSFYPVRNPAGDVQGLIVLLQDVTERRQSEIAHASSEARYRSLISATTQLIWTADADGRLTDWHDWHMYTGQPVAEIAGSPVETWMLGAIPPEDQAAIAQQCLRSLAAGTVCEVECRLRRFDGEILYFALRSVPVRDEATGRVTEWVGAGTNITERREAEAAREAALARETRIARTLQRALLVKPPGDAFAGLEFETLYQPAHDEMLVGGDFYDAFLFDGDRVAFVVGDVSGKGLEAAAHTAELKFTLRALLRDADGPEQAVSRLNDYLRGSDRYAGSSSLPGHLISLTVAVVPTEGGEAEFVVAGMEPPLILRGSGSGGAQTGGRRAEVVPADGLPLGMLPPDTLPSWDREHRVARAAFGPGDLMLLCTDGLTEARRHGTRAEFFGQEGVISAARSAASRRRSGRPASLEEIGVEVIRAAQSFAGGRLRDDVCLLLARRRPNAASRPTEKGAPLP